MDLATYFRRGYCSITALSELKGSSASDVVLMIDFGSQNCVKKMDVRTWYLCKSEVQVNLFLKFSGIGGVTVIGLQKVLAHIISKELLRNQKGSKAANHCLRSLLESMVDLKELLESSETDGSESASGDEDDDDDHCIDVSHKL